MRSIGCDKVHMGHMLPSKSATFKCSITTKTAKPQTHPFHSSANCASFQLFLWALFHQCSLLGAAQEVPPVILYMSWGSLHARSKELVSWHALLVQIGQKRLKPGRHVPVFMIIWAEKTDICELELWLLILAEAHQS